MFLSSKIIIFNIPRILNLASINLQFSSEKSNDNYGLTTKAVITTRSFDNVPPHFDRPVRFP